MLSLEESDNVDNKCVSFRDSVNLVIENSSPFF